MLVLWKTRLHYSYDMWTTAGALALFVILKTMHRLLLCELKITRTFVSVSFIGKHTLSIVMRVEQQLKHSLFLFYSDLCFACCYEV